MAHLLDLNYLLARVHSVHFTVGLLFVFFSFFPGLNECLLLLLWEIVPVDPSSSFLFSCLFFLIPRNHRLHIPCSTLYINNSPPGKAASPASEMQPDEIGGTS